MSGKPVVLLYAQENAGLIFPCPSGVIFQQQTGGYCCLQDSIEGVFVPLDTIADHAGALNRFFTGPKWRGYCDRGIDTETADLVDATLSRVPGHSTIRVNRDRLAECHEAWIHVTIVNPDATGLLDNFAPGPAVLTWPNSD